jgi:outer membrane protein TolC
MGLIPNYAINIMEQLRTQEQAQANVEATVAAKNAVRLVVISQVVGSYFGLREEQYRLERQKALVEAYEGQLEAFTKGHQEGYVSDYVLQEYRLNLAKAKAEIPVIQYNIVRLSNAIHVLLNENPGGIPDGPNFMDYKSKGIITGNLPSQVLKNRPDVIQAEAVVKQSNAQIGVATSVFFPTVSLTTPLGYTSTSLTNLFKGQQSYWQYQGGISMPVLNLGAFGAIKAAKGQYYADFFNYVETVKNAFASVDSDLASHEKYTKSFEEMVSFFESTHKRYDYELVRFKEGLVAKPEVLTLNIKRNEAAIAMAQRKLDQLMSIVRLYQDLGGGYMYKNNEDAKDLGDGRRFNDLF